VYADMSLSGCSQCTPSHPLRRRHQFITSSSESSITFTQQKWFNTVH